jgi:hypothetical protein
MRVKNLKTYKQRKDIISGKSWAVFHPNRQKISLLRHARDTLSGLNYPLQNSVTKIIKTGRKSHRLRTIHYQDREYFLKYFRLDCRVKWKRRLELFLKELLCSGARKSFLGALNLWRAGVPTAEPVAYYVAGFYPWQKTGVFISEKIKSESTIQEFLGKNTAPRVRQKLLASMALIARQVHDSGYRHTDIVPHNFLVNNPAGENPELFLIDTDKVYPARFSKIFAPIKTYQDLKCLMRLKITKPELEWFLKQYFGPGYKPVWLSILLFLQKGGFSLRRRLKIIRQNSRKN